MSNSKSNKNLGKVLTLGNYILLLTVGMFIGQKSSAQGCSYGAQMIICYQYAGLTNSTCCNQALDSCEYAGQVLLGFAPGVIIINPSVGQAPSCGPGTTAQSVGDSFQGTCAWTESGTDCGVPYGPDNETGPATLYPCIGSCRS